MIENKLKQHFKTFLATNGFRIVQEFFKSSPDFIVEKEGVNIAVELKGTVRSSELQKALAQLLFAKMNHGIENLWLIIGEIPAELSKDWIKLLLEHNIKVFILTAENKLTEISQKTFKSRVIFRPPLTNSIISEVEGLEIDIKIRRLLKEHKNGLSLDEIFNLTGINREIIMQRLEVSKTNGPKSSMLRKEVAIEGDRISLYHNLNNPYTYMQSIIDRQH